jgi:hypothetical protein
MAKAELKTKKTEVNPSDFLNTIKEEGRRTDCFTVLTMMQRATKADAKMWGGAIVGFGSTVLKYDSGRELDWFICGFSPRKANLTLYLPGLVENKAMLEKLGKYKTGKGCLYINSLAEVDTKVLKAMIEKSVKEANAESKVSYKKQAKS